MEVFRFSFPEVLIITLFAGMLIYFRIADKFNIIDKPNERSSHTNITIRGGGIVVVLAGLMYAVYSGFDLLWFWIGFFIISILSFVDDIKTLSSRVRLPLQFLSVVLMLYQIFGLEEAWWLWLTALVLSTGVVNAYNFMDGINGITAGYSLVVLLSLLVINFVDPFTDNRLIMSFIIADLVFGFFNFRKKAVCFAGDVGSLSIAFVLVFLIFQLMLKTQSMYPILLLAVYGVDSVLTIVYRLRKKENIFEAHRSHLYQWLTKPGPFSHLGMTTTYMFIQVCISLWVISTLDAATPTKWGVSATVLVGLAVIYITIKSHYKKRYGLV